MIQMKRVFEPATPDDGERILVDRLWPRGLSKAEARIDRWLKELAPSDDLRRWFGHDPGRWTEFKERYRRELEDKQEELAKLAQQARSGRVTLLYAAREERYNNAVALAEFLREEGDLC